MSQHYSVRVDARIEHKVEGSKMPYNVKIDKYLVVGTLDKIMSISFREHLYPKHDDVTIYAEAPIELSYELFQWYNNTRMCEVIDGSTYLIKLNSKGQYMIG